MVPPYRVYLIVGRNQGRVPPQIQAGSLATAMRRNDAGCEIIEMAEPIHGSALRVTQAMPVPPYRVQIRAGSLANAMQRNDAGCEIIEVAEPVHGSALRVTRTTRVPPYRV